MIRLFCAVYKSVLVQLNVVINTMLGNMLSIDELIIWVDCGEHSWLCAANDSITHTFVLLYDCNIKIQSYLDNEPLPTICAAGKKGIWKIVILRDCEIEI